MVFSLQDWQTYGLYAYDHVPDGKVNTYGVHPRLTILDKNGDASGILFLNSAAQELALTPAPAMTYRTIGGLLDLYVFLGPGPEEVVQQYTQAVGRLVLVLSMRPELYNPIIWPQVLYTSLLELGVSPVQMGISIY